MGPTTAGVALNFGDDTLSRIEVVGQTIAEAIRRLNEVADRAYGSAPEADRAEPSCPRPAGTLNQVSAAIREVDELTQRLHAAVDRVSNIA